MHIKDFIGQTFNPESISEYSPEYFPEDYDTPSYRITLPSSNYVESLEGYYYLEILLDSDGHIKKLWRYREDFVVNTYLTKFPQIVEEEVEMILKSACNE